MKKKSGNNANANGKGNGSLNTVKGKSDFTAHSRIHNHLEMIPPLNDILILNH